MHDDFRCVFLCARAPFCLMTYNQLFLERALMCRAAAAVCFMPQAPSSAVWTSYKFRLPRSSYGLCLLLLHRLGAFLQR